jgi:hypothetical protein
MDVAAQTPVLQFDIELRFCRSLNKLKSWQIQTLMVGTQAHTNYLEQFAEHNEDAQTVHDIATLRRRIR